MIANSNFTALSSSEYLAAEAQSLVKNEYRQGEIYAMAGASNHHVLITVNLATLLRTHLRGSGCRTYAADTKVRIEALDSLSRLDSLTEETLAEVCLCLRNDDGPEVRVRAAEATVDKHEAARAAQRRPFAAVTLIGCPFVELENLSTLVLEKTQHFPTAHF